MRALLLGVLCCVSGPALAAPKVLLRDLGISPTQIEEATVTVGKAVSEIRGQAIRNSDFARVVEARPEVKASLSSARQNLGKAASMEAAGDYAGAIATFERAVSGFHAVGCEVWNPVELAQAYRLLGLARYHRDLEERKPMGPDAQDALRRAKKLDPTFVPTAPPFTRIDAEAAQKAAPGVPPPADPPGDGFWNVARLLGLDGLIEFRTNANGALALRTHRILAARVQTGKVVSRERGLDTAAKLELERSMRFEGWEAAVAAAQARLDAERAAAAPAVAAAPPDGAAGRNGSSGNGGAPSGAGVAEPVGGNGANGKGGPGGNGGRSGSPRPPTKVAKAPPPPPPPPPEPPAASASEQQPATPPLVLAPDLDVPPISDAPAPIAWSDIEPAVPVNPDDLSAEEAAALASRRPPPPRPDAPKPPAHPVSQSRAVQVQFGLDRRVAVYVAPGDATLVPSGMGGTGSLQVWIPTGRWTIAGSAGFAMRSYLLDETIVSSAAIDAAVQLLHGDDEYGRTWIGAGLSYVGEPGFDAASGSGVPNVIRVTPSVVVLGRFQLLAPLELRLRGIAGAGLEVGSAETGGGGMGYDVSGDASAFFALTSRLRAVGGIRLQRLYTEFGSDRTSSYETRRAIWAGVEAAF